MNKLRAEESFPQDHMLRDLNLILEYRGKEGSTGRTPVVPSVCNDRGAVQVGVLATLVDMIGGIMATREAYPDWSATGGLRIYSAQPARTGEVTAIGSVLRSGRTTVVIDMEIMAETIESGATSPSIGSAVATFHRIPRRDIDIDVVGNVVSQQVINLRTEGPGLSQHLLDKAGLRVIDEAAGVVELNMTEYVQNYLGALEGGMSAIIADAAGQYAARTISRKPMITADLAINYLSLGKVGPFYTRTKVLRTTGDSVLTRVGIFDRGADDLLMSVATNTAMIA